MSDIIRVAVTINTGIAVAVSFANTVVGVPAPFVDVKIFESDGITLVVEKGSGETFNIPTHDIFRPDGVTVIQADEFNEDFTTDPSIFTCQELNDKLIDARRQEIQRVMPLKSGQTTSFRTGDDGDLERGRLVSFLVLDCNNPFGDTNRFTDDVGTQIYANDLIVDWAIGIMWHNNIIAANWNTAIDAALASTQGGFSDWVIPNRDVLNTIIDNEQAIHLDYAPFNQSGGSDIRIWSSTTAGSSSIRAFAMLNKLSSSPTNQGRVAAELKTASRDYMISRSFTLADLGL